MERPPVLAPVLFSLLPLPVNKSAKLFDQENYYETLESSFLESASETQILHAALT